MKKIEAIITPFKLDAVQEALRHAGLTRMTVSEVKAADGADNGRRFYRGAEFVVDFLPKIKIELLVADDQVGTCAEVIEQTGKNGAIDAEISVSTIDDIIRIRTGEHGVNAI
jgi:nitrogen regulatory protein P-II 1